MGRRHQRRGARTAGRARQRTRTQPLGAAGDQLAGLRSSGPRRRPGRAARWPQRVSASPEQLGVSLLRAPTWPDPAADNGWQRLRLALVPCPQGWCRAALPQEAVRFREPLWRRPLAGVAQLPAGLPDLGPHLQLLGLRPCSQRSGAAVLSVQNLSPLRQGLTLGPAWRLLERLDGLGRPLDPQDQSSVLAPWATGFWRLVPVQSS